MNYAEAHGKRFEPWYTDEQVSVMVDRVAHEIKSRFKNEPVLLVGVLKGVSFFISDLIRKLPAETTELDFVRVSSYHGTESTGTVRLIKDISQDISGKHVLIVDEIVDTGRSMKFLKERFLAANPKSVTIVTLLDKPSRRATPIQADIVGETIEDVFVVGYGLDFNQALRNLPGIYRLCS